MRTSGITRILLLWCSVLIGTTSNACAQWADGGHEVIVIEGRAPFDESDPEWIRYQLDYWAWHEVEVKPRLAQLNELIEHNRRIDYDAARRKSEVMEQASNLVWTTGLFAGAVQEAGCRAWKPCGALLQVAQRAEGDRAVQERARQILTDPAASAEDRRWAAQQQADALGGPPPGAGGMGGGFGGGGRPPNRGSQGDSRIGSLGNGVGNLNDGVDNLDGLSEVLIGDARAVTNTKLEFDTDVFEHNAALIESDYFATSIKESVGGNAGVNAKAINLAVERDTGRIHAIGNIHELPADIRDRLRSGELARVAIREVINTREALQTGRFIPVYELIGDDLSARALHNLTVNVEIMNQGEFGWLEPATPADLKTRPD
jgi:hypothetical protein